MSKETIVIIIEESLTRSIIKDIFTFILFAGLLYFNHEYLSGSTLIDVFFILIVLMMLIGRSSKSVFKGNKKDAQKFLTRQTKEYKYE